MSPEKHSPAERGGSSGEKFESPAALGARLIELGWTEEQLGKFTTAMEKMADVISRRGERKIDFELAITNNEEGNEVAEVALIGEGNGLTPERISDLIEKNELPVELLSQASTQFFTDQNKVILRRKRNRPPEVDSAEPTGDNENAMG